MTTLWHTKQRCRGREKASKFKLGLTETLLTMRSERGGEKRCIFTSGCRNPITLEQCLRSLPAFTPWACFNQRTGNRHRYYSIRNASIGLKFAASLAGRYPNSTPTPQETTSATATAIQGIPRGTVFPGRRATDQITASAIATPTIAPTKLMKNASKRN